MNKNASFKAKYDTHATAYQVGTVLTFAAPTSFSTSDQAAGVFCNGIQFVVPDGSGTQLHDLSAFDGEGEVVVDGPSSWQVVAATMTPTGTLVVVLKRQQSPVQFLTDDDDSDHQPHAALHPPAQVPPHVAVPTSHPHTSPAVAPLSAFSVSQVALLVRIPPPAPPSQPPCIKQSHRLQGSKRSP